MIKLGLILVIVLAVLASAFVAAAQPASQPVVAAVSAAGLGAWLAANSQWLVPLIVVLASTLATGLSSYPRAEGFVKGLRMLVAACSLVQFKDGKGSLKLPVIPPALPLGSTPEQPAAPQG